MGKSGIEQHELRFIRLRRKGYFRPGRHVSTPRNT